MQNQYIDKLIRWQGRLLPAIAVTTVLYTVAAIVQLFHIHLTGFWLTAQYICFAAILFPMTALMIVAIVIVRQQGRRSHDA